MKNTVLIISFLLANTLLAQDSSKFILIINPYFTSDKNDNTYRITNINSNTSIPGYPTIEETMKSTYYNAGLDFKFYKPLRNHFLFILQGGIGLDKYSSSIPYQKFLDINNWEKREKTEEISGLRFNFQYGIGKQFFLDNKNKLSLNLEGLIYLNSNSFDKKITNNKVGQTDYLYDREYSGSNTNYGVKCNLAFNYQMFKHFGVGLALNNLINIYGSKIYDNELFYINETETITKIAEMSRPVFSLVLFL
jgi:hypothetical protein